MCMVKLIYSNFLEVFTRCYEEDYMEYKFYGWETATVKPINNTYQSIHSPGDLYDALSERWCAETCAPRTRDNWTPDNKLSDNVP